MQFLPESFSQLMAEQDSLQSLPESFGQLETEQDALQPVPTTGCRRIRSRSGRDPAKQEPKTRQSADHMMARVYHCVGGQKRPL